MIECHGAGSGRFGGGEGDHRSVPRTRRVGVVIVVVRDGLQSSFIHPFVASSVCASVSVRPNPIKDSLKGVR